MLWGWLEGPEETQAWIGWVVGACPRSCAGGDNEVLVGGCPGAGGSCCVCQGALCAPLAVFLQHGCSTPLKPFSCSFCSALCWL